jgi:catechol 2,3-dioxygenase-like lactoylglutathione lyase family enzyme
MISHIELNVTDLAASTRFYLLALAPLDFRVADQGPEYVRITNGKDVVLVLCPVAETHRERSYHRKGVGLSHFALAVDSPQVVDAVEAHLAAHGISLLGEGKFYMDYRGGYTTLAFEDPDRIMVEIVHTEPGYYAFDPA